MAFMALHGFASSPRSRKNTALAAAFEARGLVLHRPDLNRPSFAALSFSAMLAELDRLDRELAPARWSILGSSLGGYVAALWAAANPDRVARLVLLCPAFELAQRWSTLVPPGELAAWRASGSHPFEDATGQTVGLHFAFVEEAMRLAPMPSPRCPVRVVHGVADVRVPIETSRRFVAADPSRRSLVERDDGHELLADLDWLGREVLSFFEVTR
jgi:pimeloyl-ACP methyl ester carboxylesterase